MGSGNGFSSVQEFNLDAKWLVDPKLLLVGPKIGEGAYAKVYEGKYTYKDIQSTKLSGFIVDDVDVDGLDNGADESNSDDEEEFYDSVCAFRDNGGELLCCEGRCLRSFHATKEAESDCESLGFTQEQVEAMPIFFCDNCKHEQHQCFACGKLGSSTKSSGAEIQKSKRCYQSCLERGNSGGNCPKRISVC